jgi:hypothetical protein
MKRMGLVMCCCLITVFAVTGLPLADEAAAGTRLRLSTDAATLDANETAGLLQMREEEKLARDVYLTLYATWGKRVFSNIIESEQRHMDAIKSLLDKYHLDDPAAGKLVGEFTNSDIQSLYNELVLTGSKSLEDAFKVGVRIEELDIQDLTTLVKATDNLDIKRVYANLLKASQRHLSAFESQLDRL